MTLIELAKQAVENYIQDKKIISPPKDLPSKFLTQRAGTFVTIEKNGELRGCIGTYLATRKNIAEEIIHNAIAAATEDYRFGPIQEKELPQLSYTIYILSEPELVENINGLNPKKYGIIVKTAPILSPDKTDVIFNGHSPYKSGLLLPDLKGIDTVEKQIFIACQKAGIDSAREKILIYRFTAEKYAKKRVGLKIYGRVQGVFFRDSSQRKAKELNLTGWVKNVPDGTVQIVAEGEEKDLQELIEWCRHGGTEYARVDKVNIEWLEPSGQFNDFMVR